MTTSEKITYWQNHIKAWEAGKSSQREYCRQHNLTFSSFGYWRQRLKKVPSKAPKLIPVSVSRSASLISVVLPTGVRIEAPAHCLSDILSVVSSAGNLR